MKKEDYKDGMAVIANGKNGIANGLELCGDGSYIVHVCFPLKDTQWRVPIDQIEAVTK